MINDLVKDRMDHLVDNIEEQVELAVPNLKNFRLGRRYGRGKEEGGGGKGKRELGITLD